MTALELALPQESRRAAQIRTVGATLAAVALGLAAGSILIVIAGGRPWSTYADMAKGAFGSLFGFSAVLVQAVPLLVIGLGLALAFRGRVYNIGAEGQFYVGALAGGAAVILLPIHVYPLLIALGMIAGAAGGAAWGWLVGKLRARWGVNEVITSLLLNYIGIFLFSYAVRKPLRDPDASSLASKAVPEGTRLPNLPHLSTHIGIVVGLALVPLLAYVMDRTPFGFRVRMMGLNADAASVAGVDTGRMVVRLMVISGGLAGLAGIIQVLGVQGRLDTSLSQGYGFTAIVVALLGRLRAVGVLFAALLLGGLTIGGQAASIDQGLPYAIVLGIQGVFVVFVLVADRFARA